LWRLLFYVDKNTKKGIEKHSRVHDSNTYADEEAPLNAPDWTKSGYEGPLKSLTTKVYFKMINQVIGIWKIGIITFNNKVVGCNKFIL